MSDRIFQTSDIEDICTTAKTAIDDTKDCINSLKRIASDIQSACAKVPNEAKRGNAEGLASGLGGKLDKDNYDTTRAKLEACREKACSLIPEYDSQYASQMQEVTAATNAVKGVIEDLKQFMLETPLTACCDDFAQVLAAKEAQWKRTLKGAESLLDGAIANAKGAQEISTIFSKDPVNLSTGNFIYDKEDLRIEGSTPFIFRRFYNAVNRYHGSLGRDWNHNYEVKLSFQKSRVFPEKEITILLEDGKEELFLPVDGTAYTPGNQSLASLKKTEEGYEYRLLSGERYLFDTEGRYLRQEDADGEGFSLQYGEEGKLLCIQKDTGESYQLSYDGAGYLKSVADHTGRIFTYEVKDGRLLRAVRPDGGAFLYEYNGNGKLESVTNPRGIVTVENVFDERHRTTCQRFPDGTQMSYEYNDDERTVTLTERNGSRSIHIHDEKYRNIRNIYPDGEESFEYNSRNQKTKITDKLGYTTRLSYDNRGNLTGAVNPLGTKLAVTYGAHNQPVSIAVNGKQKQKNTFDGKGNLLESRDALGRKTAFVYDGKGRPAEIIQADGSRIRLSYDERGNITELTDAGGGRSRYAYDALNRVTEAADPKGNRTRFTYDSAGNILSVTNPAGEVRSYEYNESHKVTKVTDFDGSVMTRTYNRLNRPEVLTDQLGRQTRLQYDAMWNLARITAPDGGKTTYFYNENNRLTRIKDALGNVTRYTYDGNGNRLSEEDETGAVTRFTYDALGRLTTVTGPDGAETAYVYDMEGNLTEVWDALGNKVQMEYDEAGQLIRETNPLGESRSYTYTALGDMESITDEAGRVTSYTYLPGGQVGKILHPEGTEESYTYDAGGNVETYTNEDGFTLTYVYDSLDRIIRIEGSGGEEKEYTYDAAGNVTSMTDASGNVTRYEYSPAGELTKVIDALGNETEYRYDPCGRLIEIRQYGKDGSLMEGADTSGMDAELLEAERRNNRNRICHVTKYQRNLSGQVETITDALGQKETYRYDPKGRLLEKLDKEGYLTAYGYTDRGDVSRIRYADGREVKLSYNSLRRLTEMEDWLGITKIENDALGRAEKVTYPDGREVSYTYGKGGERTSITYPDGRTIHYGFDESLRLSELKDGDRIIRYAYDKAGRLTEKSFPNGMRSTYCYDRKGQVTELRHEDKEGVLDHYAYQYDLLGNKTGITRERRGLEEESGTYAYGYDALGRLESVTKDGNPLRRYGYDAFGNRTALSEKGQETAYAYNALNQLVSKKDVLGEISYRYDRRGNLIQSIENGDIRHQYTYGALNRLERAVNGRGETASYQYNGLGYRTGKTEGRIQPETLKQMEENLNPLNQLKAMEPEAEKTIRYTIDLTRGYHNLLEREENQRSQIYLWDGNAAGFYDEGEESPQYYLQDELGSPLRIEREDGHLRESYGYDEFGCDLYGNQGKVQPFGYTGYQQDTVAGTYFAQAREYERESGRFLSQDLIAGFADMPFSMNRYVYCFSSIVFVDMDGTWPSLADIKNKVTKTVKDGVKWLDEHKGDIGKIAVTVAGVAAVTALTVSTFGVGAGAVIAASATVGGTVGAVNSAKNGTNIADGLARGALIGTVGAIGAVANPTGAFLGGACQLATDLIRGQVSSPEAYAGAMLGGAIGTEYGSAFLGGFTATGVGELLEKATGVNEKGLGEILTDSVVTGIISSCMNWAIQKEMPYDLAFFFRTSLSEGEKEFIETILAAIGISGYYTIKDYCVK